MDGIYSSHASGTLMAAQLLVLRDRVLRQNHELGSSKDGLILSLELEGQRGARASLT